MRIYLRIVTLPGRRMKCAAGVLLSSILLCAILIKSFDTGISDTDARSDTACCPSDSSALLRRKRSPSNVQLQQHPDDLHNTDLLSMRLANTEFPIPISIDDLNKQFYRCTDVELRPRVKLVIADEGVPISTQWDPHGYPYPIQIAQFGLWHFSQLVHLRHVLKTQYRLSSSLSSSSSSSLDLDLTDSRSGTRHRFASKPWVQLKSLGLGGLKSYRFFENSSRVVLNHLPTLSIQPTVSDNHWQYFLLSGRHWHVGASVRLYVTAFPRKCPLSSMGRQKTLVYTCAAAPETKASRKIQTKYLSISSDRKTATFWMPQCASDSHSDGSRGQVRLARDLVNDLFKAFGFSSMMACKSGKETQTTLGLPQLLVRVQLVQLFAGAVGPNGGGIVHEMRLGASSVYRNDSVYAEPVEGLRVQLRFHAVRLAAAVSWLLRHQDSLGAWRTPVSRDVYGRPRIASGWASAMGQGQAISLLVRVYNLTGIPQLLLGAQRALPVFDMPVASGGVLSYFLNHTSLPWFEEYPTEPGNYVLNGFIYALLGLRELSQVNSTSIASLQAKQLWQRGLTSLSKLLPLFDSGSGSFYDLRHVDVSFSPSPHTVDSLHHILRRGPNQARSSYHNVHIELLRLLSVVDTTHARQWLDTAYRWLAYTDGRQSPHN